MSVDDFLTDMLTQATEKFPECGFLLYVVDDREGDLTLLTNMDADEVADVQEAAMDDESQMIPMGRVLQ